MFTSMYPDVAEDFADEDAAKLDTWVFDEVRKFFDGARTNETLKKMLFEGQIVFFLHLLGWLLKAQVAQARNMIIGEHRHCCVTFMLIFRAWATCA